MSVSTWSFRCLHSSVRWSWSWWNLQYLLLSLTFVGTWMGLSHCRASSSFICINTCLIGITRGVKLVNLGLRFGRFFSLSNACPVPHVSFVLSGLWLVPSSFFLLVVTPLAITVSSAIIYFWALWSNSATIFSELLLIEKKKSPGRNPTWKVVRITWSSASSTYNNFLLNYITYYLSDSPFAWRMLRRCPIGFLCHCPPMKWQTKPLLS